MGWGAPDADIAGLLRWSRGGCPGAARLRETGKCIGFHRGDTRGSLPIGEPRRIRAGTAPPLPVVGYHASDRTERTEAAMRDATSRPMLSAWQ